MSLIPGTLVVVRQMGILLRGPAGCGKSDTALALIQAGHQLVADDAVALKRHAGHLIGSAPAAGAGLLCLRGPGLIAVAECFGARAVAESARLDAVIDLIEAPGTPTAEADWAPVRIHGVTCPRLAIAPTRPVAALLEALAASRPFAAAGREAV